MKVHEVEVGLRSEAFVRCGHGAFPDSLRPGDELRVLRDDESFMIATAGFRGRVEPTGERWAFALGELADSAHLAWVLRRDGRAGRDLVVEGRRFPHARQLEDETRIAADEKILEDLRRHHPSIRTMAQLVSWLTETFLLPDGDGGARMLLSASGRADGSAPPFHRIHGRGHVIDVEPHPRGGLRIRRLLGARSAGDHDRHPLHLARGRIVFADGTVEGELRESARSELDRVVQSADSYLQLWENYDRLERKTLAQRGRDLGFIRYESSERRGDGAWRFHLAATARNRLFVDGLRRMDGPSLEANETLPPYLLSEGDDDAFVREMGARRFRGDCADLSPRHVDLMPPRGGQGETVPPRKGKLFLSLDGDETRLKRRKRAREKILGAECPMPQLGLLIEGKPSPCPRHAKRLPRSSDAWAAFGGRPTEKQIEALDVALNTPDIALVQGPPGTGKTRVIAALQIRLAELAEAEGSIAKRSLVSSFQHDAVENAMAATRVLGLPALKVGGRRDRRDDATEAFDRWRAERIEAIEARLSTFDASPLGTVLARCRAIASAQMMTPYDDDELPRVLRDVAEHVRDHVPAALREAIDERAAHIERRGRGRLADDPRRASLEKALRALRVEPVPFGDDGPDRAYKLLRRLEGDETVTEAERGLLEGAADWEDEAPPPFLAELAALRDRHLDRLGGETNAGPPTRHDADVEDLLDRVIEALHERLGQSPGGVAEILSTHLAELRDDPVGVARTVERYTAVLGATCQQAASRPMSQMKGDTVEFESVVVDEAARANPLDLFIPMSLARRRIVLVGDHRQLPHMLEHEIERDLETEVTEKTRHMLRESLFERLFQMMKQREREDGVRRCVTLDRQYRMHPALGDFVSRSFYEAHGEGFTSPLPAASFAHAVPGLEGKVAAWGDVPMSRGKETPGRSKSRRAEATWIAERLAGWLHACPTSSFGVVSFYSAQVGVILRALKRKGLVVDDAEKGLAVASAYQTLRDENGRLRERLRVGTVDAFQGKEFDVVILSMTRSNDVQGDGPASRRRRFGHLCMANRLCVAMSRQKRLLVVVGDRGMLDRPGAAEAVPALRAFAELCKGELGRILPFDEGRRR